MGIKSVNELAASEHIRPGTMGRREPGRGLSCGSMIVSCGEALVDLVPHPVPGGGPMNVAVAVARLGVPAAFAGGISTDDHGRRILDHLRENRVDVSACQYVDAPTARAIVEHVPELVFRFEGTDTADTMLSSLDLATLPGAPHVLHGGTLGLFRGRTAETLAAAVERHDGLVSIDPNVRPQIIDDRARWDHFHERWVARADIYKASDEDLAWIRSGRSADSVAEELLAGAATAVVVTRGADGLTIYTTAGEATASAPAVEVVDTVGAGDTIVAVVLASLWEAAPSGGAADPTGLSIEEWTEIARRGVTAAAITCARPGADPPHRHELDW